MQYRSDIDGLRALAVLPVIFYHAGASLFSGGFIGVDVFFVISGYLITTVIIKDLDSGFFSLGHFYERRARRILPALTLVVLATVPFAYYLLLPDFFENYGQSVFATMLSSNNILLALTGGYWDLEAEFKPLLHTWSLGVEEQFYIFLPILLMALWPILRMRTGFVVAAACLASFVLCIITYQTYPNATFYLLPTRAWELGIGALGAYWALNRTVKPNDLLAATGISAILVSAVMFDSNTPFPSAYALVPTLGTLLVLMFSGNMTRIGRLLSMKPLVFIGLISYSLYLWHQPLFAFARINSYEEPSDFTFAILILACFILSYLSWRFVEKPFRNKHRVTKKVVIWSSITATAGLSLLGLVIHLNHGFPQRFFDTEDTSGMFISYNEAIRDLDRPGFSSKAQNKVLIIGNSQARDFANILMEGKLATAEDIVYRDEKFDFCAYGTGKLARNQKRLVDEADIVFIPVEALPGQCLAAIESGALTELNFVFVGPKHFGYNLNKFGQLPASERPMATARIFDETIAANNYNKSVIPSVHYLDLLGKVSIGGVRIPIFDGDGMLISGDRIHVTENGARYFGERIRSDQVFDSFKNQAE